MFSRRFLLALYFGALVAANAYGVDVRFGSYRLLKSSSPVCQPVTKYLNHDFTQPFVDTSGGLQSIPFQDTPRTIRITRRNWNFIQVSTPFDLDNDGHIDNVFVEDQEGTYIYGNVFYVLPGSSRTLGEEEKEIDTREVTIFPCQFDKKVPSSRSCPPISQDGDDAGISVHIKGKTIFFRGRYVFMEPVKFRDRTFLVLKSESEDTKLYSAVIEPMGGKKYRPACIFKGVAE